MDFELTSDQLALRDAARDLLDDLASPTRVRAHTESAASYDTALWAAMVDQGWPAIEQPGSRGGLDLSFVEAAVLLDEIGRHGAPVPIVGSLLARDALDRGGRPDLADRLASGESLAAVAGPGHHAVPVAEGRGGAVTLTGTTAPVVGAPSADIAIVVGWTGTDLGLFAVEVAAGDRPEPEPAMDPTRPVARYRFGGVPAIELGGADAVEALADRGATAMAALLLGGSSRVLDMAVAYAGERHQFGRPIGSFQAIKHRCADMLVDVEGMRSATYWAAWCVGARSRDASLAASSAKIWAIDASKRVMASALQVHGGIGFTWEHDLHFFWKRAQLDQWSFGAVSWHQDRLARALHARVAAGEPVI